VPKRTYVGSHAEVVLPDGTTCKKGSSIEVSGDVDVKELDLSGNWQGPSTAKSQKE
jgi:hypothetical protein